MTDLRAPPNAQRPIHISEILMSTLLKKLNYDTPVSLCQIYWDTKYVTVQKLDLGIHRLTFSSSHRTSNYSNI